MSKNAVARPKAAGYPWRMPSEIRIEPARASRWDDLEQLFGDRGACGGCWCMWYRLPRAEYERGKGARNRSALRRLVRAGEPVGIIAYAGGIPIGWCAVAPRSGFIRLETARTLEPVDDRPVWSVVCLFVARSHRRQGVSVRLLNGASEYARSLGAEAIEGYPVVPRTGAIPEVFAHPGTPSAFRAAGFREVARRSAARAIMRRQLTDSSATPRAAGASPPQTSGRPGRARPRPRS
jgi:GNAT superfamily N-acetyltransferase